MINKNLYATVKGTCMFWFEGLYMENYSCYTENERADCCPRNLDVVVLVPYLWRACFVQISSILTSLLRHTYSFILTMISNVPKNMLFIRGQSILLIIIKYASNSFYRWLLRVTVSLKLNQVQPPKRQSFGAKGWHPAISRLAERYHCFNLKRNVERWTTIFRGT